MKVNLSLTIEKKTSEEIKATIPHGEVSSLVDNLLKEYLKREKKRKLIEGYQANSRNKKLQQKLSVLEEISLKDVFSKKNKK